MATKCVNPTPEAEEAVEKISSVVNKIKRSFDETFGGPLIGFYDDDIKITETKINEISMDIKLSEDRSQKLKLINKRKELQKDLKALKTDKRLDVKKLKYYDLIKDLMVNRLVEYADSKMYNINPDKHFPVMKHYTWRRYMFPYKNLSDLSVGDLQAIYARWKKIYKKIDAFEKDPKLPEGWYNPKRRIRKLKMHHKSPAEHIIEMDGSGRGYELVLKTHEMPGELYSIVNKYDERVKNIVSPFFRSLKSSEFLFNVNKPIRQERMINALTQSKENLEEFAVSVLDGRNKFIIPQNMGPEKQNVEWARDRKDYEKIVRHDIQLGIGEGKNIQKFTTADNQVFYYVAIKQDPSDHDGREVWYAYQVPHKEGGKKDFLFLPRMKGKSPYANTKRKEWDEALGETRIATYKDKDGKEIPGRMPSGWYSANTHKPLKGKIKRKVGIVKTEQEFTTSSYGDYEYIENINTTDKIENQNELPPGFHQLITEMRSVLEDFYTYVHDGVNITQENIRTLSEELLGKGLPKHLPYVDQETLDNTIKSILNVDGLNNNISVWEGKIYTSNAHFAERSNYYPWRFDKNSTIKNFQSAIDATKEDIDDISLKVNQLTLEAQENGVDNTKQVTDLNSKLERLKTHLKIYEETKSVMLGTMKSEDMTSFPIESMVAATRRRTNLMNPFDTYYQADNGDVKPGTKGRIGSFSILHDYFERSVRPMFNNDLKIDLLKGARDLQPEVVDFLIDHVKATMGRSDIQAGFLGIDYDIAPIRKFMAMFRMDSQSDDPVHQTRAKNIMNWMSMILSGNLLGLRAAMTNNFQLISPATTAISQDFIEVGNLHREIVPDGMQGAGKTYAQVIAEESGATDLITALADALLGGLTAELTGTDGYFTKKDMLILNLPLVPFKKKVRNSKVWRRHFLALIERRSVSTKPLAKQLENLYEGTWELVNGVASGSMSKKELDAVKALFENTITDEIVNKYASWGLSGGMMAGIMRSQPDKAKVLTFTGAEQSMRTWTAVLGAVMAVRLGEVPDSYINETDDQGNLINNPYLHPSAIKFARILNNVTMFGLSHQFNRKWLRGDFGKWFFKFKQYSDQQADRELTEAQNLLDSLSEKELMDKIASIIKTIIPLGGIGTGKLGKDFFDLVGLDPRSHTEDTANRLLWSRVFFSAIFTFATYSPLFQTAGKMMKRFFGGSDWYAGAQRGGTSVVGDQMFRIMALMSQIISYGSIDEDDRDVTDLRYFFFPIWFNMAFTTLSEGIVKGVVEPFSKVPAWINDWWEEE